MYLSTVYWAKPHYVPTEIRKQIITSALEIICQEHSLSLSEVTIIVTFVLITPFASLVLWPIYVVSLNNILFSSACF